MGCTLKRHHPLFYISPIKEEVLSISPWIIMMHDFLSEEETTYIKNVSTPLLHRSGVFRKKEGEVSDESHSSHTPVFTAYRVSKTAWLKDMSEGPLIRRVSERGAAAANLT